MDSSVHPSGRPLQGPAALGSGLIAFVAWLGDAVAHAFGNPREEAALQPPLVGVQPFHGLVSRRRRRR